MIQNVTRNRPSQGPTAEQIGQAAAMCCFDELKDEQIAKELGICRRTLARWKRRRDFDAAYRAAYGVWKTLFDRQCQAELDAWISRTSNGNGGSLRRRL